MPMTIGSACIWCTFDQDRQRLRAKACQQPNTITATTISALLLDPGRTSGSRGQAYCTCSGSLGSTSVCVATPSGHQLTTDEVRAAAHLWIVAAPACRCH